MNDDLAVIHSSELVMFKTILKRIAKATRKSNNTPRQRHFNSMPGESAALAANRYGMLV